MRFLIVILALVLGGCVRPSVGSVPENDLDRPLTRQESYSFAKQLCRFATPPLNLECLDEFDRVGQKLTVRSSLLFLEIAYLCIDEHPGDDVQIRKCHDEKMIELARNAGILSRSPAMDVPDTLAGRNALDYCQTVEFVVGGIPSCFEQVRPAFEEDASNMAVTMRAVSDCLVVGYEKNTELLFRCVVSRKGSIAEGGGLQLPPPPGSTAQGGLN